MTWSRVVELEGEVWALNDGNKRACATRWIVALVRARRTTRNPTGEMWRAFRDGAPVTRSSARGPRLLSWGSRYTAQTAVEEIARLER